ncbi:MAG: CPBP family intramembrane metalloprotease [Lachnospiraceae bacterium]|nr:CPBP family intramembrane metalloprotease [Lachnospiraceae bacterium]
MKKVCAAILVALVLWTVMFSPVTAPHVNLWLVMTIAAVTLTTMATYFGNWYRNFHITVTDVVIGVGSAAALWGVFWVGDKLSQLMFNFARPEVNAIYSFKESISPWLLSALLLFIIGPAEEIFWRGFVQKKMSEKWGATMGFVMATAVYALVHAGSCNFMLVMAALVAGGFWGLIYRFYPNRLGALVISHAVWDAAVFVWFPI